MAEVELEYTQARRQIPAKLRIFKLLLPQLEALESKQNELNRMLTDVEAQFGSTKEPDSKRLKDDLLMAEQLLTTVHVLTESVCKPDNAAHVDVDTVRQRTKALQHRFDVGLGEFVYLFIARVSE